ncbi:MAG: hypothetical protein JSW03_06865 [Candidatus Eiseniibacteriota bacterium]|nr:MAG: hypothetical protein JSW03_06865 [Candidatus Eisenbacteria bacterium]
MDYLSWRLLLSPKKEDYRVCHMGDLDMVVKLCGKGQIKYVDILLISDDSKSIAIRRAVSSLAGWAARRGYSYLRFLTTKNELSNYLGKTLLSTVRRPPFVFYATDPDLRQRLEEVRWHWQLIDSDFEVF